MTSSPREAETLNPIFVGVHCRRTDYENHLKVLHGEATLVDHNFFDIAFDIYRRRYDDGENKVIFLAVSDDTDWIKVNSSSLKYYHCLPCRPTWVTTLM